MKLSKILLTVAALASLTAMTSCRKELCYNHFRTASVMLTWEQEWERDYGMAHADNWDSGLHGFEYHELRPGMPDGVTLVTYKDDVSPRESFMSAQGGEVGVDGGDGYSLLMYNNDTEYIVLSDMASLADARASTTARVRSSLTYITSLMPAARTTNPPDVLYAAYVPEVPHIEIHENRPLPVQMQPLVYTYHVRYEFEHGLERVALARGALGGMAESVYLRNGVTSEDNTIILYDCEITSYGCKANVHSFGVPGFPDEYYGRSAASRAAQTYSLNLEVRLTSGKTMEFNYDISDQIVKQPRGGVIRIKGIRIEDDEGLGDGNSAFDVEINDWGEHEDIDLPVGGQQ